jgi:hypothetical protein
VITTSEVSVMKAEPGIAGQKLHGSLAAGALRTLLYGRPWHWQAITRWCRIARMAFQPPTAGTPENPSEVRSRPTADIQLSIK